MIPRSPFLRETVIFTASTVLMQGTRFVVNLAGARILGPETWGLWYLLNLVLAYGSLAHLGVLNGMNRDVPVFRGAGDNDGIVRAESTTLGYMILCTAVLSVGAGIAALLWPDDRLRAPLFGLAALIACTQFSVFCQTRCKAENRFLSLCRLQIAFAILLPALTIPLTLRFGLSGFVVGQAAATLLPAVWLVSSGKWDLRPRLDRRELRRLIRVGFPIMLVGVLFILFGTVDRWVIARWLGTRELGHYTLALMAFAMVNLLPLVVAQQVYPRMAEQWGRTRNPVDLLPWVRRQTILGVGVTLPVVLLLTLAFPPLVGRFLPEYAPGIPSVYILMVSPLLMAFANAFANMLNTMGRQMRYLAVQAVALPVAIGLDLIVVSLGYGIEGIAAATSASFALYTLGLIVVGLRAVREASPPSARAADR